MKDKKTKRSKIILLSSIFQIVLLLLMIGIFILKMNSLNLWIQGITDMSVFFIIWFVKNSHITGLWTVLYKIFVPRKKAVAISNLVA